MSDIDRRSRGPGLFSGGNMDPNIQLFFIVVFGIVAVSHILYLGGIAAAWLTNSPSDVVYGLGVGFLVEFIGEGGPSGIWPNVPLAVFWTCCGVLTLLMIAVIVIVFTKVPGLFEKGTRGFAAVSDVQQYTYKERADQAKRLRPTLENQKVRVQDVGLPIGELNGKDLYSGIEDVTLSVMAPRSGKTVSLAVPQILDAPGAVIATSNKADIWTTTVLARERGGSKCWTFDPQSICGEPCTWFWNPLRGIVDYETAIDFCNLFLPDGDSGGKNSKYFTDRGRDYMAYLVLAAAVSERPDLSDVDRWMDRPRDPEPVQRLQDKGLFNVATALATMLDEQSMETIEGVFSTARTACGCFKSASIMQWVTPGESDHKEEFDIIHFLKSTDTLYLLSLGGDRSAAPLVGAFTDRILHVGRKVAQRTMGGRLDPPLVAVLDEAANIVKIPSLPARYSYFGSLGMLVHTILQNTDQAEQVWGKTESATMWSAATCKIIGSGIDKPELAREIATFIGETEVDVKTVSGGGGQGGSRSLTTQKEQIWTAADVREIPQGKALLMATGTKPALIDLKPWYKSARVSEISSDQKTQERLVESRSTANADPALLSQQVPKRAPAQPMQVPPNQMQQQIQPQMPLSQMQPPNAAQQAQEQPNEY